MKRTYFDILLFHVLWHPINKDKFFASTIERNIQACKGAEILYATKVKMAIYSKQNAINLGNKI